MYYYYLYWVGSQLPFPWYFSGVSDSRPLLRSSIAAYWIEEAFSDDPVLFMAVCCACATGNDLK